LITFQVLIEFVLCFFHGSGYRHASWVCWDPIHTLCHQSTGAVYTHCTRWVKVCI